MNCRTLRVVSLVAAMSLPIAVHAQGAPTTAALRESKARATATFLDKAKPAAERIAAAGALRYPDDPTFTRLLAVGADKTEPDEIRLLALAHHRFDDRYLDVTLKVLDGAQDGGEVLDAGLVKDVSRRLTSRQSAPVLQRVQRTLRKLLRDPRAKVRLEAFRSLVGMHDPIAVNELDAAMRRGNDGALPVPLTDAIELLHLDGAAKHIQALRPYLNHADPAVQGAAVHALALDPQSRAKIVELAQSPQAAPLVRQRALRGLAHEDPAFASYALPLVESSSEDSKVRLAAMKAFAGRMNYERVEADSQVRFAQAIERMVKEPPPPSRNLDARQMRAEAQALFPHLQKAFPEVRKHYENR